MNAGNGLFGGFNLFGVNFLRNFWNERIRSENMKMKDYDGEDHVFIRKLKKLANETGSSEYYSILGNLYLRGAPQYNVKVDIDTALGYYEKAAEGGDLEAQLYVGSYLMAKNKFKSFKYLSNCAEGGLAACHFGLGTLYNNLGFEKSNVTKAIQHFDLAVEGGFYDAAVPLAEIYSSDLAHFNMDKADYYMDIVYKHGTKNYISLETVEYYKDRVLETLNETYFDRFYDLIANSEEDTDIKAWYSFGYRKYTMGDFDRALLAFSFGALMNHVESMKAAAYIWANNLTNELS